jgi:hypothetical protein
MVIGTNSTHTSSIMPTTSSSAADPATRRDSDDADGETMARLGLEVNTTKTRIARLPEEQFDFLGYTVGRSTARTGAPTLAPIEEVGEELAQAYPRADYASVIFG